MSDNEYLVALSAILNTLQTIFLAYLAARYKTEHKP